MTMATRRTSHPPMRRSRQQAVAAPAPSAACAPEGATGCASRHARLTSMHSFPQLHAELFAHLCDSTGDSSFEPHLFSRWDQLLRECERVEGGIVLLDFDEAERSPALRALGISAHRLAELVARELFEKPAALILLTAHDFVEVEDLMRVGVHALLHPHGEIEGLAEQVRAALDRRVAQQACGRRTDVRCDIVTDTRATPQAQGHTRVPNRSELELAEMPDPVSTEPMPVVSP